MKTTLSRHIDKFRMAIGDNFYAESEILKYLNEAQDELAAELKIEVPIKRTMSQVAYQEEYTIPSTIRKVYEVRVENNIFTPKPISKQEIERYTVNERRLTGMVYNYWLEGNKLGLYYLPDASAAASTVYTAISSTTTTTIVIDYETDFPTYGGSVIIDSEIIYYKYLAHTSTTYTTLSGCTRGAENTVAATHSAAAVVTLRDIEYFGYAYPSKFLDKPNSGAAAVATGTGLTSGSNYIYEITYYSTSLAMESLPYIVGIIKPATTNLAGALTSLPVSTDSNIDYKKVYRTKADGSIYYYLGTVANATTTYSDTTADTSLSVAYAEPYSQIPEENHRFIDWMALRSYFRDREEMTLMAIYQNNIDRFLPQAKFDNHVKPITQYQQRPLPE